jgi:hypothetical protein
MKLSDIQSAPRRRHSLRGSLEIRACSLVCSIQDTAAFLKRKASWVRPMRSLYMEELSDGVRKDQISALACSCLFYRLENDAKALQSLRMTEIPSQKNRVASCRLIERCVVAGPWMEILQVHELA